MIAIESENERVNRPASELLYDSEGALRLVATALQELQGSWELLNAPPNAAAQRNRESGIEKAGNGKGETGKGITP